MERMDTKDFLAVILDMTQLVAKLENELSLTQQGWKTEVEQLHHQYQQKLENLKDKINDPGKEGQPQAG